MHIGVLALQGDYAEHASMLEANGAEVSEIRLPNQLDDVDGLIIPGGESTTIVQLIDIYDFRNKLVRLASSGFPIWGTCAGLICIANKLTEDDPKPMGLIDAEVSRNWFGRQIDSFETNLKFKGIRGDIKAVFIRAPIVNKVSSNVEVLSTLDEETIEFPLTSNA